MPDGPDRTLALAKLVESMRSVTGSETAAIASEKSVGEADSIQHRSRARVEHLESLRQANIEQILRLAGQEIDPSVSEDPVDKGWLIHFFESAKNSGDDLEHRIWARLLAGELASPGGFSKRSLSTLSLMDRWELEGFIEWCAFAFAFESGWRFMFDDDVLRREMWTYGRDRDLTHHFVNIGLLSAETSQLRPSSCSKGLRLRYSGKLYEIRTEKAGSMEHVSAESGASYRRFTAVGQQLAEVIRTKSFYGYARSVLKVLDKEWSLRFEVIESPSDT
ncbi:DUF2806 domain-containing protein [Methylocaldum sp.]|uniref:DUF2806 domain-containing protein n=1 Tax=Methylocaldum sp. TaxID=1969727 RepID=UPI002D304A14|nr:DUF2806 domain-containing protein [Methylocaldum sp.]HYE35802.1 DUF2806 domain-containing protein [Methylocaldum sp.]